LTVRFAGPDPSPLLRVRPMWFDVAAPNRFARSK